MKKLGLLLVMIVAALVLTAPASADTATADQLEPLRLMGLETPAWMTTNLGPIQTSFDCSRLNYYGCRYIYNIASMCCVPYRPDPGANCPSVCL